MENYVLTDAIGTQHTFAKVPQRIVSLVPSQTELLVDLGLESKIVGITKFCIHPKNLRNEKVIVGGTKKVDYDKIKSLAPDIIVCNKEENTLEMVENLRQIGQVWVTDINTLEDNFQMISDFGNLFDCMAEAENWNQKIALAMNDFKKFIQNKAVKRVAYFIWKNPYMVAAGANFINEMLLLNRFENAFAKLSRYPEVNIQEINKDKDLDYVFLSSEPYPFKEKDALEISVYTHSANVILVDGEMFSWYGSRILKAFDYFKKLHQNL
ncbi:ABC transporter substrate-binding protein [Flavobacterium flavipallidum]|uniref:Helical backbone metal receptor n=1 Tax=Flavobacterium flavipallidum TaxID=3139140 RepID=A0ABU9HNC6_9FLAO